ncbi:hypothetical protein [Vibrio cholerae]|nr:hypothetical protein [Vibrio cholerae]EHQ2335963.1 hypothetical protein [Vibrio cholerae]EJH65757.1 hypothetical protein VCHE25_1224 [Vibrio cholerae HE-25]EJL6264494.1 hypothetical protein [Vibrio cholerae]EJL6313830.1 hypothetical protein [Vibrio cholerae]EJL6442123.1 hypothetical protein [Vibrio cholerae]
MFELDNEQIKLVSGACYTTNEEGQTSGPCYDEEGRPDPCKPSEEGYYR